MGALVSLDIGLTVGGIVTKTRPLFPQYSTVGNILAFIEANIHEDYLKKWVDLSGLVAQHPHRVVITNSMVRLKGPVAIITSLVVVKVALAAIVGLATGVAFYKIADKAVNHLKAKNRKIDTVKYGKVIFLSATIVSVTAATLAFAYSSVILPIQPGVYFLGS